MTKPRYDLLRPFNHDPDALKAAMADNRTLRDQVEAEVVLLEAKDNRHGYGSIIERCVSSRLYASRLRKALE